MEPTHRNLDVWKLSKDLVLDIYILLDKFPKNEQYALADQLRRASISVPSNIAEGCARNTEKEKIQFLYIARGSCAEIDTQIVIAKELHYINADEERAIIEKLSRIGSMLTRFIQSLKRKNDFT